MYLEKCHYSLQWLQPLKAGAEREAVAACSPFHLPEGTQSHFVYNTDS